MPTATPTSTADAEPNRQSHAATNVTGIVAALTQRVQQWSLMQALCDTALTGMLIAAVLVAIDYFWRPDSAIGRWLISLPFWLGVGWIAAHRLGPIAFRSRLQAKVVASLCRRYAPLQDRLPAALDFERLLATEPHRLSQREVSTPLMRHVVAQTFSQLREIDWSQWIDLQRARRSLALTLGLLVAGLSSLGLRSELILTGLPRVVVPVCQLHWPSWYEMEFQDLPTEVPPFATVPIRVVSRTGHLPDPIWLETISDDRAASPTEPLAPDSSSINSTTTAPSDRYLLDRRGQEAFGALTIGNRPLWVRVISGQDPAGAWHRIDVVPVPQLLATTSWQVQWTTGERPYSVRVPWGPLRVPANAQVALDGEFDRAVSQVELELQPVPPDANPENTARGLHRDELDSNNVQRISLDVTGRRFKFPRGRSIRIIGSQQARLIVRYAVNSSPLMAGSVSLAVHSDQQPVAKWSDTTGTFGSDILLSTPAAKLKLPINLADDGAIADYRLAISAADEPAQAVIMPDLAWHPVNSPQLSTEALQIAVARPDAPWPTAEVTVDVEWPPTDWTPPVEITWKVQVLARDSAGQESRSSERLLRIVPTAELEAQCLAELNELSRLAQQTADRLNDWPAWKDHRALSRLSIAERHAWVRLIEDTLVTAGDHSSGLIRRMTEASRVSQENQLLRAPDRDQLRQWQHDFEMSHVSIVQRLLAALRSDVPTESASAEYTQVYGSLIASWQALGDSLRTLSERRTASSELLVIWRRQVELGPRLLAAQRALLAAGGRADLEPVAGQLSDWAGTQMDLAGRLETWLEPYTRHTSASDVRVSRPSEPPAGPSDPLARVAAALQARQIAQRMDRLSAEVAAGRLGHALTLYRALTLDFHAAISAAADLIGPLPIPPELAEQDANNWDSASVPGSDEALDRLRRLAEATGTNLSGLESSNLGDNSAESAAAPHADGSETISPAEARFWLGAHLIDRIQRQLRESTMKVMDASQRTTEGTARNQPSVAERLSGITTIQAQQQELAGSLTDLIERFRADASRPSANQSDREADQPVDDQLDRDLFSAGGPDEPAPTASPPSQPTPTNRDAKPDESTVAARDSTAADWQLRLAEFERLADAMGRAAGLLRQEQFQSAAVIQLQIVQRMDELLPGGASVLAGPTTAGGEGGTATGTTSPPNADTPPADSSVAPTDEREVPIRVPAGWGKLPQREQQEIPTIEPEQFLPGYESFIRDYFQRLGQ